MDYLVLLKGTPELKTNQNVRLVNGLPDRTDYHMNDWDQHALEIALRLKEKHPGTITTLSYGGKDVEKAIQLGFALGVDRAILVHDDSDPALRVDSGLVAKTLAKAIEAKNVPYDLILAGAQSEDQAAGAVATMIAGYLNIPQATYVASLDAGPRLAIKREREGGHETLEMPLGKIMLTITETATGDKGVRMPGLRARLTAKKKKAEKCTPAELGMEGMRPRVTVTYSEPPARTDACKNIDDDFTIDDLAEELSKRV